MTKKTRIDTGKLGKLKVNELQAMFAEVTGEKTRSPNKTFLIRRITEVQLARESEGRGATGKGSPAGVAEPLPPERLTKLDVPTLQARYIEVVGRPSGSGNKAYLIWKIREAQKGRIPMGPRKSVHLEGVTFRVLPLRMEAVVVDKIDEAWRRLRLHSRTDLFRKALQAFFQGKGESDVAALFATTAI